MNGAKVLIVGQNPGNNPKAAKYKNHTIDRLNKWCDELGVERYGFFNAVTHQGKCKIQDVDFVRLQECVDNHNIVIALGAFASKCLELINKSHFRLPHPSPLNRLMNDKEFVKNTLADCKEFIENRS
jgi:uracil-DNA glycosylase